MALALAGAAPDCPVDGRGGDAARRARDHGARVDRHRGPGDPPRGRGHGRRHRTGAGTRRRAGDAGRQRGLGARARLQRQRGAHPRAACRIWAGSATRWWARPSRSATPSTASISISATTFPRSASWSPTRSTRPRRRITHTLAEKGEHITRALGTRRRQHDRSARRARRRPPGTARRHQPRHARGDRGRQRPAHRHAQFQDRPYRRRIHRDRRQPAAHDVGTARPRDRRILAEVGGHSRHDDRTHPAAHRAGGGNRQQSRRRDRSPG